MLAPPLFQTIAVHKLRTSMYQCYLLFLTINYTHTCSSIKPPQCELNPPPSAFRVCTHVCTHTSTHALENCPNMQIIGIPSLLLVLWWLRIICLCRASSYRANISKSSRYPEKHLSRQHGSDWNMSCRRPRVVSVASMCKSLLGTIPATCSLHSASIALCVYYSRFP